MPGYSFGEQALKQIRRAVHFTEARRQNPHAQTRRNITPALPERWYTCRNDSGAELPAYAVVEVDSEEEQGGEIVYVVKKIGTTWPGRVAVLSEDPLAADGYGAITFDPTFALCDSANVPGPKQAWGIKPNETKLFKGYPGFRALGRHEGSGSDQRGLVRQAWPAALWALAPSGIPARTGATPGSGTVNIYTLASGSLAATDFTATAVNASAAAVVADKYLQIVEIEDDWAANYEDCAGA